MSANQFDRLCMSLGIDPAIALENENIRAALADRDDARVQNILETEF